jgi:CBS-domain-containing membrane protein
LGETLDIDREDVETLVREVERRVLERRRPVNRGP